MNCSSSDASNLTKEITPIMMRTIATALLVAQMLATAAEAQTAKVRAGTLAPKGSSFHKVLMEMGEAWKNAPHGGVVMTLFTDGTMGNEADMVRRMRIGQLQAAMLTAGGLAAIDESVGALQNMPMMFRSLDELDYVTGKLRPTLEKRIEEKGFVVLFWADAGWVRLFAKTPAARPDEFKRLKVFVGTGSNNHIDLMKAMGYQPVPLEITDALTGLQTGLIDAMPSPPFYALAGQFFGPAPHMLEINWVPLVGGMIINKKTWDTLPADTKAALRQSAAEAGEKIKARNRQEADEAVEAMKKRGLKVLPLTPDVEAEWVKLAESAYPRIRGRIVPAEMFDEVQRLVKEYRQQK
jgi:TRAP-type C4-dicarboxylate transport system substrate-binding protein